MLALGDLWVLEPTANYTWAEKMEVGQTFGRPCNMRADCSFNSIVEWPLVLFTYTAVQIVVGLQLSNNSAN